VFTGGERAVELIHIGQAVLALAESITSSTRSSTKRRPPNATEMPPSTESTGCGSRLEDVRPGRRLRHTRGARAEAS